VKDSYNIVSSLKTLFVYVFADRLLLRLKKVDDRSTQAGISTLVFNHDEPANSELLCDAADDLVGPHRDEEGGTIQEGEGMMAIVETSELKTMGKRVEV
jgi:hypothetical protein